MKIVHRFSNSVTVRGGMGKSGIIVRGGMIIFAGEREIVSWVDGNLRRSAKLFQD